MNIEEKLKHFQESSIESARARSIESIEEYTAALNQIFEEHKEKKRRQAELELKTETDSIKRENNKRLSQEQIGIRRDLTKKNNELKEKLFIEVETMITAFMATAEYQELLVKDIRAAVEFAKGKEMKIYLDPADEGKKADLEKICGVNLLISEYSFLGGMRAVIEEKHILIDNSFATRLAEVKENFSFDGGDIDE